MPFLQDGRRGGLFLEPGAFEKQRENGCIRWKIQDVHGMDGMGRDGERGRRRDTSF